MIKALAIISSLWMAVFLPVHRENASGTPDFAGHVDSLYSRLSQQVNCPPYDLLYQGLSGYDHLRRTGNLSRTNVIALIDFRMPSTQKRLWVIDLDADQVIFDTWVAHGRNSGEVYATQFSNAPDSEESSLGFYVTGNTYIGKHGLSMVLRGMEKGINDRAESRAIVMHGADYVSEDFINRTGRLGRSFGCPAIPDELHESIIKTLAGGACLFIYYPDTRYLQVSQLLPSTGLASAAPDSPSGPTRR